ncbi:MAG: 3D domain-containing protein [Fimbriimonadaceae bacterium]|nr:3D domain-containing protein [Fimbriimonadaceae bacterium]
MAIAVFSAFALQAFGAEYRPSDNQKQDLSLPITTPEQDESTVKPGVSPRLKHLARQKVQELQRRSGESKRGAEKIPSTPEANEALVANPPKKTPAVTNTTQRKPSQTTATQTASRSATPGKPSPSAQSSEIPAGAEVVSRRALPFEVSYVFDRNVGRGRLKKVQDGKDGEEVTIKVERNVNGQMVTRTETIVTRKPQNEVFHMGAHGFSGSSRGSYTRARVLEMEATAYTPDAGLKNPTFRTRTGRRAEYGVIAVDPRVIPLNSLVFVEGYGFAIAADTGGAIKGNKIDVCLESHSAMRTWGRRVVKVHVFTQLHTKDQPRSSIDETSAIPSDFVHLPRTSRGAVSRRSVGRVNVNQPYRTTQAQRQAGTTSRNARPGSTTTRPAQAKPKSQATEKNKTGSGSSKTSGRS